MQQRFLEHRHSSKILINLNKFKQSTLQIDFNNHCVLNVNQWQFSVEIASNLMFVIFELLFSLVVHVSEITRQLLNDVELCRTLQHG